jgi:hypothetical protein
LATSVWAASLGMALKRLTRCLMTFTMRLRRVKS